MWYNAIIKGILRSPLHGMLSKNMMLITVTGHKSGKVYTLPVNYVRDGGVLTTISYRHRTWWRNLRNGTPVTLRLQGQDLKATGAVVEDNEDTAAGLMAYLQKVPQYAKYLEVALDASGQPKPEDVARAAKDRVIVYLKLM